MLEKLASHYEKREIVWGNVGEGGFGNETIVDKVTADMMHLIDPTW